MARTHTRTSAHTKPRWLISAKSLASGLSFLARLDVVMMLAKALQVSPVDKQLPVALMWDDVVNYRRRSTLALLQTIPAERLFEQLRWPQVIRPDWQVVPAVVIGAGLADVLRLVCWAPSISSELRASAMSARSQRFVSHGLSPPGQNKNARTNKQPLGYSSALAFNALAIVDINDILGLTVPAEQCGVDASFIRP